MSACVLELSTLVPRGFSRIGASQDTGGKALPKGVKHWSMTTLREKLIKIGAKVVAHSRYVVFQMAEVAIPRGLFRAILERNRRLRPPSVVFR